MKTKYSIKDACKIAIERNGLCLSDRYINCNASLLWKCAKGRLPFTGLKMLENGAHIAQKINLTLLTMLNGLQIIKMENAFQKIILIVYYHCSGDVLKDMNGIQHLET